MTLENLCQLFESAYIAHNKADISKAKELLSFEPKIGLEDGLAEFCRWVKGQEIDNSKYELSLSEMEHAGLFVRK